MIDAHTHLDVRSFEDLENMAIAGIETIITQSHDPYKMSVHQVYLDHWDRLINLETKRGKLANVDVKVCVGVHPMGYPNDWKCLIDYLPKYLEMDNVVGIGETGLHYLNKTEEELLISQINIAKEYDYPIVIHTPEKNKEDALKKILKILDTEKIDDNLVMIDHINMDTVNMIDRDVYIGLTIQPTMKIDYEECLNIIKTYEDKKFILSSDLGSLKADIYALPKMKLYMKNSGLSTGRINDCINNNAKKFYNL